MARIGDQKIQFIKNIINNEQLINDVMPLWVSIIRDKIIDKANDALVNSHTKLDWSAIKSALKDSFGDKRDLSTLCTSIPYLKQGSKDLTSYYEECRNLLADIKAKILLNDETKVCAVVLIKTYESMITNAFIDGLHANLSSLTRIYRPDSLLKAYESALDQYNAIQRRRESFPQRMVPFTKNNSFREQSQQQSYFMHKKPFRTDHKQNRPSLINTNQLGSSRFINQKQPTKTNYNQRSTPNFQPFQNNRIHYQEEIQNREHVGKVSPDSNAINYNEYSLNKSAITQNTPELRDNLNFQWDSYPNHKYISSGLKQNHNFSEQNLKFSEGFRPLSYDKENSFLRYLNIKTQIGNLKFLVDTGSNKNYISPEHIHPTMKINCVPHLIKNISGSHNIDKFSELNIFFNYKSLPRQKFLLFRFHKFFDGLIGYESLKSLGAIIDTVSNELLIGSLRIPMNRKTFNGTETNFQINNIHGGKTLKSNKTQNSDTDHNVQIDPSIIITKYVSLFNPSSNPVILETDLHNKMYSSNRTNLQNKQEHNYRKERINRTVQTGINQNHAEIIENFTYTKSRTQQPSHKLDKNNGSDGTVERFRSTSNEISRCYRHKFGNLTTNEMFLK
ncbi:uncharacterized protein LOC129777347 [Toxorhynchites rutilus septentrionalis]|uniref:uncharacterized protein LOC129777347 n=1 Tax=Toxorhynchites rutilus septentrionalis TaxID=329112 RepID=UPI002478F5B4|nr:uncharacterized protein LOC129777347 [Toxorhynchites rutilus septentrionalis]